MPRRRKESKPQGPRPNDHWVISDEYVANGRHIVKDTELSIKGVAGRFRFVKHVYNPAIDAEWIDVVGGPKGYSAYRSYHPDRIKTVHYKNKTGTNLAAARKKWQKEKNAESEESVE